MARSDRRLAQEAGRRMTRRSYLHFTLTTTRAMSHGLFASLTPEQQKAALDYRGPDNLPPPALGDPLKKGG